MFFSLCSIGGRSLELETIVCEAAALGYTGIELWERHIDALMNRRKETDPLAVLEDIVREQRLKPTVLSSYGLFLPPGREGQGTLGHLTGRVLPLASRLGVQVRILTDWVGSQEASEEQWVRIAEGLRTVAAAAEPLGVGILLETHGLQLSDTTESTLRLLDRIGHPNVRVNLDIFHLFSVGENVLDALDRLYPYTANVHLKNGVPSGAEWNYGIPLGDGAMDFTPFLEALNRRGYTGGAGFEWFGEESGFLEAAKREIGWLGEPNKADR